MAGPREQLVDSRGDVKLQEFSGRDEDWPSWPIKAHAFFALMGWDEFIDTVEASTDMAVDNAHLGERGAAVSKLLHAMLITKTQRKALAMVTLAGRHEGFVAWRAIKAEYEPGVGNRFAAMLSGLLNPKWDDSRPFTDQLVDWDNDVARYTMQAGKDFGDEFRIATLLVHSPEPFKTVLRNAPTTAKATHAALRAHLREWQASGLVFAPSGASGLADAMEVGIGRRYRRPRPPQQAVAPAPIQGRQGARQGRQDRWRRRSTAASRRAARRV